LRQTFRQFLKFAIVGAISTAIDWGIHTLLYQILGDMWNRQINAALLSAFPALEHPRFDGAFTVFKAVSFAVATLNGFYFNRRWTFRIRGREQAGIQLLRFFIVTSIGMGINVVVASQVHAGPTASMMNYYFSLACGTASAMMWNFLGHKFWSFRVHAA
jgi:putative flippase GtrA